MRAHGHVHSKVRSPQPLVAAKKAEHELCISYVQDVGRRHSTSEGFLKGSVHLNVLGIM